MKKGFNLYDLISPIGTLQDSDKDMLVNYSSKVDYVGNDSSVLGQFISSQELISFPDRSTIVTGNCLTGCKRCTSNLVNQCLECLDGYKLYLGMCKKYTGIYLKVPLLKLKDRFISLKTNDISRNYYLEKENQFTLTVWIKFYGQLLNSTNSCFIIFRLTKDGNRYISYCPNEYKLYFYEGTSIIYTDTNVFYNMIGQWCLISISNYYYTSNDPSDINKYFQKLQKFYVHDKEIKKIGPDMPQGWIFNTFDIGYEFSASISDFKIYRNFIINPYSYVTSSKKDLSMQMYYPLDGKTNTLDCVTDNIMDLTRYSDLILDTVINTMAKKLGIDCKYDYNPYSMGTCSSNFFNYIDLYSREVPCSSCDKACLDNCANTGNYDCQCDFTSANQILRYEANTTTHYCDVLPYFDFSKLDTLELSNIKASNTGEYALEFWMYLYSYNQNYVVFDNEEIIWDYHTYIKVFYFNNNLGITCNPIYQIDSSTSYKIYERTETLFKNVMTWVYISCSVSIPQKKFTTQKGFIYNLDTDSNLIPDNSKRTNTKLVIRAGSNSRTNYGFLFIKDMRLWSIYDINNLNTNC